MLALEVSNHSLSRQVEAQKEESTSLHNGKDALTDAIAQMGRKIEALLELVRTTRTITVKMNLSIETVDQLKVVENPMVACKMVVYRVHFHA